MKRFLLVMAVMALAVSGVQAQVDFTVEQVNGVSGSEIILVPGDTATVDWLLRIQVGTGISTKINGYTSGFKLSTPDGADWSSFEGSYLPAWLSGTNFDLTQAVNYFPSPDEDTLGFYGATLFGTGAPPGFNEVSWQMTAKFPYNPASHQTQVCLDSVTIFRPTNTWKWTDQGNNEYFPTWPGELCYTVIDPNATSAELVVTPGSLSYEATEGDGVLPTQTFDVTEASAANIDYTASETADWISLTNPTGTTPGTVTVGVDATGLTAGTYTDSVMVSSPDADADKYVVVSLTVNPPLVLQVTPEALSFTATQGDGVLPTQNFDVSEAGGANVSYDATKSEAWMTLTNASGTTPATVTVGVDATGLVAGTYEDTILVQSPETTNDALVVVTLEVAPPPLVLGVSPTALTFNATEGDAVLPTQKFEVFEVGGDNIAYEATSTQTWIALANASGTTPDSVTVEVDATDLLAGVYTDTVVVTSTETANDEMVIITLNVSAPGFVLQVSPGSLSFSGEQGAGILPVQDLVISEQLERQISFDLTKTQSWLILGASSGTTEDTIAVQADVGSLLPGVYEDTIIVSSPSAAADVKVPVSLTVSVAAEFVFTPDTIYFTGTEGGPSPVPDLVEITVSDGSFLSYLTDPQAAYITVDPVSGTTPDTVSVSVDISSLVAGTYLDSVLVNENILSASVDPAYFYVHTTIQPPEAVNLVLSDTALVFDLYECDDPATIASQLVSVSEAGGGAIDFSATGDMSWFSVTPDTATTPSDLTVSLVGPFSSGSSYDGVITVASADADNSPLQIHVTVNVSAAPALLLSDYADTVDAVAGEAVNVSGQLVASLEGGLDLDSVVVTYDDGFSVIDSLVSHDTINWSFSGTFAEPGTYSRCLTVSWVDVDGNCDTSATFCIEFQVSEAPCATIVLSDTLFEFTAVQGDPVTTPASRVLVITGDPFEIAFPYEVAAPLGVTELYFINMQTNDTGSTVAGTTGDSILVVVDPSTLPIGLNTFQPIVTSDAAQVCDPKLKMFTVEVTVSEPIIPSTDTVRVATVPAVPGMSVMVPVSFSNSCPTEEMFVALGYDADYLHVDSVSYADSRLLGFETLTTDIGNDSGLVWLNAVAGIGTPVAPGSGNWANLYFSVRCEAPAGAYPIELSPVVLMTNPEFHRDCGEGIESEVPEFIPGSIVVDTAANYVCGYVVDTAGNSIPGAHVQLWGNFGDGSPIDETMSSGIGSFAFSDFTTVPFDLYAYADGYYPGLVEDLNFGAKGVMIYLTPLQEVTPTSAWVDYYCDDNTFGTVPLPIGSVVEAFTPGGLLVGQFVVQTAGEYGFMPVYRASDQFSDDGAVTGEEITFRINGLPTVATGDTEYPAEYAQVQVCLSAGEQVAQTCQLGEGWNLVSWSVDTDSDAILDVLGQYMDKIEVILGFERGGLTYDPDLPQFSTLWYTDHLSGYWVKVAPGQSFTLEVQGFPVSVSTPIPVTKGWNLVSYLPDMSMGTADALASLDGILLYAYGWDGEILTYAPGMPEFSGLDTMMTCNGYWVKVSDDGTLVYPDGSSAPIAFGGNVSQDRTAETASTYFSDVTATNRWINLYGEGLTLDGKAVAAGSMIEAYSENGRKVGEFVTHTNGEFGFMPVYGASSASDGAGVRTGEQFYLTVNGTKTQETFTWTENGDRIAVQSLTSGDQDVTLPDEYSLSQNYPNPFNPTTTISFTVPTATEAKLEVFNLLGHRVATPFDGTAVAGENQVVWDGRNDAGEAVASGVYFYRLSTDTYTETRKMMLLK